MRVRESKTRGGGNKMPRGRGRKIRVCTPQMGLWAIFGKNWSKMRARESKLRTRGIKMRARESKLRAHGSKMRTHGSKGRAYGSKMRAHGTKMRAHVSKGRDFLHFSRTNRRDLSLETRTIAFHL